MLTPPEGPEPMRSRLRAVFFQHLLFSLQIIWPVLSGLIGMMIVLGFMVGLLERWGIMDGLYFAFVTGMTIGYGDLVPTRLASKVLALVIGLCGILLTGLVVAVAVRALGQVVAEQDKH